MQVRSLGREDSVEKEMATHSGIPAWKIPQTEKPGGHSQSMGPQRVRHDRVIKHAARTEKQRRLKRIF